MVGGSTCQDFKSVQHLSATFLRPETFRNDLKLDLDLIKTWSEGGRKNLIPTRANELVVDYLKVHLRGVGLLLVSLDNQPPAGHQQQEHHGADQSAHYDAG